jgi:RHS Repeat
MKLSFRAIKESLVGTIREMGSVVFTSDRNLYITKSDGTPMKITDIIFMETDDEIETIETPIKDKIYVSKESFMMYTWSGTEMIPVSGSGGGAPGRIKTVTGTAGELTVIAPFTFQGNGMKVYRNGVLMEKDTEYTEGSDRRSIVLKRTVESGEKFTFEISGGGSVAIEGIKYSINREFNDRDLLVKEIYSGDDERVIEYFYNENGLLSEKRVTREGQSLSATYNYDESGKLTGVVDEGTEVMAFGAGGGSLGEDEIIPQEKISGQLEDSSTLRTDIESLVETVGILIDNQEELERQHALDILNTQIKYDIALDMVGNQCGDYYIDSLQDDANFEFLIACRYDSTNEEIR